MRVTGAASDRYRFRTTPLRNVELTGPYGHDGAITSLRAFVEHYSESDKKLLEYDPSQLESALRGTALDNAAAILAQRDTLLDGVVFSPDDRRKADAVHERPDRCPRAQPLARRAGASAERVAGGSALMDGRDDRRADA